MSKSLPKSRQERFVKCVSAFIANHGSEITAELIASQELIDRAIGPEGHVINLAEHVAQKADPFQFMQDDTFCRTIVPMFRDRLHQMLQVMHAQLKPEQRDADFRQRSHRILLKYCGRFRKLLQSCFASQSDE